ncbi:MAG: ATP-binding protein [Gammaproteobacteria bacterium]|nr:ATP-binding protein [Gammaproteobacteria bacterium]
MEFYRQLAVAFGLMPRYRRTQQWKELKDRMIDLMDNKNILPALIIDEARNLSHEFWFDFPSFLNCSFDSRDMMTGGFVGHPRLDRLLGRVPSEALRGRIEGRHVLQLMAHLNKSL